MNGSFSLSTNAYLTETPQLATTWALFMFKKNIKPTTKSGESHKSPFKCLWHNTSCGYTNIIKLIWFGRQAQALLTAISDEDDMISSFTKIRSISSTLFVARQTVEGFNSVNKINHNNIMHNWQENKTMYTRHFADQQQIKNSFRQHSQPPQKSPYLPLLPWIHLL